MLEEIVEGIRTRIEVKETGEKKRIEGVMDRVIRIEGKNWKIIEIYVRKYKRKIGNIEEMNGEGRKKNKYN